MKKIIITRSPQETFEFAKKLARKMKGGETIGLVGDLGAGKTVFSQGFASGLGVKNKINSPTFVLMKIYNLKNQKLKIKHLCHIDAYRLKGSQNLASIGAEEYINRGDTITIVEWAERIKKILPKNAILIKSDTPARGGGLISGGCLKGNHCP